MVHLIWQASDGSVLKGLEDCDPSDPDVKAMVDLDVSHGALGPGETSPPIVLHVKPYSWVRDGDPANPITECGLYLGEYYTDPPTYQADSGKTYCDGGTGATFGGYTDAGGSNSPSFDFARLIEWGDAGTGGIEISLDRGRTWQAIKTGIGNTVDNRIEVPATALDVGVVDGQIDPGDRAQIQVRVKIPSTYTDPSGIGIYLCTLGMYYTFTD